MNYVDKYSGMGTTLNTEHGATSIGRLREQRIVLYYAE